MVGHDVQNDGHAVSVRSFGRTIRRIDVAVIESGTIHVCLDNDGTRGIDRDVIGRECVSASSNCRLAQGADGTVASY